MSGHLNVVEFPPAAPADGEKPDSLLALFAREEAPLLRFATGLAPNRMIAEDLVQEAFIRLHARFSNISQPRPWLYRCVKNLCLNHHRRAWREEPDDDLVARAVSEPTQEPDYALDRREQLALLQWSLTGLPDDDLEIVRRKYFEGESYQQISEATGLKTGTIGSRLHHALKHLADALRQTGHEHWNWEGAKK